MTDGHHSGSFASSKKIKDVFVHGSSMLHFFNLQFGQVKLCIHFRY